MIDVAGGAPLPRIDKLCSVVRFDALSKTVRADGRFLVSEAGTGGRGRAYPNDHCPVQSDL